MVDLVLSEIGWVDGPANDEAKGRSGEADREKGSQRRDSIECIHALDVLTPSLPLVWWCLLVSI